mgnify:CR=1 FL=1
MCIRDRSKNSRGLRRSKLKQIFVYQRGGAVDLIDCLKRDYYTMLKLILEMKVKLVYDKTFIVFVFGIFTLVLVCVHCARAIPNVSVHFASQKQLTTTPTLISIIF